MPHGSPWGVMGPMGPHPVGRFGEGGSCRHVSTLDSSIFANSTTPIDYSFEQRHGTIKVHYRGVRPSVPPPAAVLRLECAMREQDRVSPSCERVAEPVLYNLADREREQQGEGINVKDQQGKKKVKFKGIKGKLQGK